MKNKNTMLILALIILTLVIFGGLCLIAVLKYVGIDVRTICEIIGAIIILIVVERIIDNGLLGQKKDYFDSESVNKDITAEVNGSHQVNSKDRVANFKKGFVEEIKKVDSNFDERQFLNLAKNIFLKFQKNLDENNIDNMKSFLTDTFFKEQKRKEEEKNSNNANKMNLKYIEFGGVRTSELHLYSKIEDYEIITVKFQCYEIKNDFNLATGEKIKGLSGKKIERNIFVEFKRKMLNKDSDNNKIISSDCPKCGAPIQIASTGKCHYCGAIIQIETNGWKINSVRRDT